MQFVPNLITALQEHLRSFGEGTPKVGIVRQGTGALTPVHAWCIECRLGIPGRTRGQAETTSCSAPTSHRRPQDLELRWTNNTPTPSPSSRFAIAYELLVATILSAQCTDERVNQVTPAHCLHTTLTLRLSPGLLRSGWNCRSDRPGSSGPRPDRSWAWRRQSSSGMAGRSRPDMDDLVALPGVGRKTANVVLGHALDVPGLPVDRHVLRVANRIGLARSDDPEVVERQLCAAVPAKRWTQVSDTLILHGRRICKPRPLCDRCAANTNCEFRSTISAPERRPRRSSRTRS